MDKKKNYTELQQKFLDALLETPDIREAMRIAGYSDSVKVSEVVNALREEIIEQAQKVLVKSAGKAAHKITSILDDGNVAGAGNSIKAAQEILNRVGVVTKSDDVRFKVPSGGLVILPAKDVVKPETEDEDESSES